MELLELPDELLSKIFRYLTAPKLANVGLVCQRLNAIANGNESLWKWYCFRANPRTWSCSALQAASIRFFIIDQGCSSQEILKKTRGHEGSVYDTNKAFHRLRMNPIFAVEPRGSKMAVVCYQQNQNRMAFNMAHHPCAKATMSDHKCNDSCNECEAVIAKTSDGLRFQCPQKSLHNSSHAYFLRLYHGIVSKREQCIDAVIKVFEKEEYEIGKKFSAFGNAACNCKFMPIGIQRKLPPAVKIQCVKPGIYSSKYGVYGWELINFRYGEDGKTFEGIKITGDSNVPAGQFTVRVQLTKPVLLTPDDQLGSIEIEKAIDRARSGWTGELSSVDQGQQLSRRPFWTPTDCHIWNEGVEMSKVFHEAYMCEIQVAETGFVDPKIEEGLFYAFDDDTFGMWLEDRSFFRYYRATNVDTESTL